MCVYISNGYLLLWLNIRVVKLVAYKVQYRGTTGAHYQIMMRHMEHLPHFIIYVATDTYTH